MPVVLLLPTPAGTTAVQLAAVPRTKSVLVGSVAVRGTRADGDTGTTPVNLALLRRLRRVSIILR